MDRLLRARVLVAEATELGLSVDDLVAASAPSPPQRTVPTVREYRAEIEPTFSPGTRRTYRSYWLLAERLFGDEPVDVITSDDIDKVVVAAAERARAKRPGTDARSPRENCVAALRAFFERARRARYVLENPAAEVTKPRRNPTNRRGLDEQELDETIEAVRSTSRDPELDLLLVEFHLVSGARQEGALRLGLDDIDDRRSTTWLREKFGKLREQPIPRR
jgi:integrase